MTEHGNHDSHESGTPMSSTPGPSDHPAPAAQAAGAGPAADASSAGDAETQARLAALAARRQARAPQAAATVDPSTLPPQVAPGPAWTQQATPQPAPRHSRPARPTPGKASRLAMAGGAIGLSLGLVGAMAHASADAQNPAPAPATTVQRVVVPSTAAAPASQIIVVLPDQGMASTIQVPALTAPTIPERPAAPAPVVVQQAPVAESEGS